MVLSHSGKTSLKLTITTPMWSVPLFFYLLFFSISVYTGSLHKTFEEQINENHQTRIQLRSTRVQVEKNILERLNYLQRYNRAMNNIRDLLGQNTYLSSGALQEIDDESLFHRVQVEQEYFQRTEELFSPVTGLLNFHEALKKQIPHSWPLRHQVGYVTSPFGQRYSPFNTEWSFHSGVDIASSLYTPILSAADGEVIYAGLRGGYGNTVIILHSLGYRTLYGHNARLLVRRGQRVEKGQPIALLGQSGRTTGPHVHFEVQVRGRAVDPWPYLTQEL